MHTIENVLRIFADFIGGILGMVETDSHKNSSPLWSVIAMAVVGIMTLALIGLGIYAITL
jgi:hypothetical protein